MQERLTGSEALYGFVGWITTRDEKIIASAKHDANVWAEVVDIFIKENDLPNPRFGWENSLIQPKDK